MTGNAVQISLVNKYFILIYIIIKVPIFHWRYKHLCSKIINKLAKNIYKLKK